MDYVSIIIPAIIIILLTTTYYFTKKKSTIGSTAEILIGIGAIIVFLTNIDTTEMWSIFWGIVFGALVGGFIIAEGFSMRKYIIEYNSQANSDDSDNE